MIFHGYLKTTIGLNFCFHLVFLEFFLVKTNLILFFIFFFLCFFLGGGSLLIMVFHKCLCFLGIFSLSFLVFLPCVFAFFVISGIICTLGELSDLEYQLKGLILPRWGFWSPLDSYSQDPSKIQVWNIPQQTFIDEKLHFLKR